MNEFFLHYVWQYQLLSRKPLYTTKGEIVIVLSPGWHNAHAGPDFQHARLSINGVEWYGHIEVHWKASDWKIHRHTEDPAYNTVILHLVWEEDSAISRPDGSPMPTLEMGSYVSPSLVKKYKDFVRQSPADPGMFIPCGSFRDQVAPEVFSQAITLALEERINRKVDELQKLWEETGQNWEEAAYRWWARGFGFSLHKEAFSELSERVPYTVMARLRDEKDALDALYFGMSGLLPKTSDDPQINRWIDRFQFYQRKYTWTFRQMDPVHWRFGRTRPGNFPTVRIAQWVAFLQSTVHLHTSTLQIENSIQAYQNVAFSVHPYWENHVTFGPPGSQRKPTLPKSAVDRLLLNVIVPYHILTGRYWDDFDREARAWEWMKQIPAESNSLLEKWHNSMQILAQNARDAQGLMGLYQGFCQVRRCALCPVGQSILQR